MCLARRRHEKLRFTNRKLLIKPPKVCFDRRRNSNFRFTNRKLLVKRKNKIARRRREKKNGFAIDKCAPQAKILAILTF